MWNVKLNGSINNNAFGYDTMGQEDLHHSGRNAIVVVQYSLQLASFAGCEEALVKWWIATAISLALLGAIFGLALCHSHPNTAVKITTISLFSAIGVVVGSLVTPLFNAATANICNLRGHVECKIKWVN